MYASVTLPTQIAEGVLAVPLEAISARDPPSVMTVGSDGTMEEKDVIVGMRTASLAEIKSGLSEGDLVVIGDRSGLAPGMVVSPKLVELPTAE
jgi:multidrug efflux pump subunit AcrA (membrane-fusion protein)